MTGKTHMAGGIAASMAIAQTVSYDPMVLAAAGMMGALLPDLCHGGSKIGRKAPVLSKLINILFGHRTFTHSLLFLFLIQAGLGLFVPYPAVNAGITAGIASHLLLDAATKKGIRLLYPLDVAVRLPITVRTGGVAEKGILTILILGIIYFAQEMIWL